MTHAISTPRKPTVLVILDGFGLGPGKQNNAIAQARTPNLDHWFAHYPSTTLSASGLPDGQMGNSEVGHLTLGCGHVVRQDMVRIDDSIANVAPTVLQLMGLEKPAKMTADSLLLKSFDSASHSPALKGVA